MLYENIEPESLSRMIIRNLVNMWYCIAQVAYAIIGGHYLHYNSQYILAIAVWLITSGASISIMLMLCVEYVIRINLYLAFTILWNIIGIILISIFNGPYLLFYTTIAAIAINLLRIFAYLKIE